MYKKYGYEEVLSLENLYESAVECIKTVKWKNSSKRFEENFLVNLYNLYKKVINKENLKLPFIYINLNERGKHRKLETLRLEERIIHKCIVKNLIYPLFTKSLIYDNYAAQKGKGCSLSIKRLKYFINSFLNKHKEGYILLIDIKSYYESIDKEILFKQIDKLVYDEDLKYLLKDFINSYSKGLSLGSEMNQIFAVHYLNEVDHFIKDVLKVDFYGRYMDDSYIICESKEKALFYLNEIEKEYSKLNIEINKKKTKTCKLNNFKWLQNRITVYGKNNIKIKARVGFFTKQRKRIKSFVKFYYEGKMTVNDIVQSYQSWRGNSKQRNCNVQYEQMDEFFLEQMEEIFNKEFENCDYTMIDGKIVIIEN